MDSATYPMAVDPATHDFVLPDPVARTLAVFDSGLAVVAPEGHILWANTALAGLAGPAGPADHAGREPGDLVGTPVHELAGPADRDRLRAALSEVRLTRRTRSGIRVVGLRPGTWLELALAPAPPVDGRDDDLLVHAVDVTEAVVSRRSLQMLSENASDIVATTDAEGRVTWVSASLSSGLGHRPEDLIGHELSSLVALEDLQGLADALAAAEPGYRPATRTVRFRSSSGAYRYMSITARPAEGSTSDHRTVVSMRDVTEELRAKRELARSEEQFRMALMGAPEGMAVTDSQDRIVQANPALCELLGTNLTSLIGHRFREFIPEDEREQVDQWRERLLRGGVSIERSQHRLVSPTSEVWVDHSVGIMRDDLGNPQLFVHQFADRTAARRLQADLAYRASHDVQTGLANRDSLRTRLGQRLGCPPESAEFVGVLFCDIDNLKPINDRYGHLVGDAVIATVANRLERSVRRQDVVARVGGDEFVILLDHCGSLPELRVVASNVHAAASHPVETQAGSINVTITVGAVLAESSADTDDALARADAALYRAKRSGRNRISVEGMTED